MNGCKCLCKTNSQRGRETEILLDREGTSATARCMWIHDAMGCAGSLPPPDLQHLLERSVLICNSSEDSHATLSECIASQRRREAGSGGGGGEGVVAGSINRKTGREVNRGEKRRNAVKEERERG